MSNLDKALGSMSEDLETAVLLQVLPGIEASDLSGWRSRPDVLLTAVRKDYSKRRGLPGAGPDELRTSLGYDSDAPGEGGLYLEMFKQSAEHLLPEGKKEGLYAKTSIQACEAYLLMEAVR